MRQADSTSNLHSDCLHPRDRFPRMSCTCIRCQATCRVMPGMCIPGDLDRIAQASAPSHLWSGEDAEGCRRWIAGHFRASAESSDIPIIVLASRNDGSCIFYDRSRCLIHEVAPFGCSHLDPHLNYRETAIRIDAAHDWIRQAMARPGNTYIQAWAWLASVGSTVEWSVQRRVALCEELARVTVGGTTNESKHNILGN